MIRRAAVFFMMVFALAMADAVCGSLEPVELANQAVISGDVGWLKNWLDRGGDPNRSDAGGWTPLLLASARGQAEAVRVLLFHPKNRADARKEFVSSGALPIHLAGQSGSVETAAALLEADPSLLDEVWLLNGHTLLLQAVFYGHLDLAKFAVEKKCNTAATTLRGLCAIDFARQFQNAPMEKLLAASEPDGGKKKEYYEGLLERVREKVPPEEVEDQALSDQAAKSIVAALKKAGDFPEEADAIFADFLTKVEGVDVCRLAGDLRQPLLVIAVTGNNAGKMPEAAGAMRQRIVAALLERGADPLQKEKHPMGAHSIIRASVFGHLEELKKMGAYLTAQELADALNEVPAVNGLTALHDAVLRSGETDWVRFPFYLAQIRWEIANGARPDIPDFSGKTQADYVGDIEDEEKKKALWEVLFPRAGVPQWNHAAIAVPSLEDAERWYREVFGFEAVGPVKKFTPESGAGWELASAVFGEGLSGVCLVRMRAPGAPLQQVVELFEVTPAPPVEKEKRKSGIVHGCLIVSDVRMLAERVRKRGGEVLYQTSLGDIQIAFCRDLYGNTLELASSPW